MSAATRIAGKDLKLRLRDRSAIILGIVAPLVLAFIFKLVFGGVFDANAGLGLDYGLVDLDDSQISTAFAGVLDEIESQDVLTVVDLADANAGNNAIDEGSIAAYFLIPAGFGAEMQLGGGEIEVVGDIDAPTSTQIAASIATQFGTGVESTTLAILTTAALTNSLVTPEFIGGLEGDPSSAAFSFELVDVSAETRQLDTATFFAAGMAIFFLFFTVQFGVTGLLEEERDGTLARLMVAPMSRYSVVVGKALLSVLLGVIAMGVLIVGSHFLMGAVWGAPLGVALLVIAGVLSAVGLMGLVASFARSPEAAGNLGSILAVILGMLGGTFFPLGQGDDFLSNLTLLTPHAWFMRGLGDLAGGAPWTEALPAVGALLLFGVISGAISFVFLRRRLWR